MSNIRVSKKHGVNPSVSQCFFCLGEKNEVILFGKLPKDAEAPRIACIDHEPCDKCKGWMEKGVILASVADKTDEKNPYRTGGWLVVTEDYVKRAIEPKLRDVLLKTRFAFVPDKDWDELGYPRPEAKEEEQ